jgi:hypothetical protein
MAGHYVIQKARNQTLHVQQQIADPIIQKAWDKAGK